MIYKKPCPIYFDPVNKATVVRVHEFSDKYRQVLEHRLIESSGFEYFVLYFSTTKNPLKTVTRRNWMAYGAEYFSARDVDRVEVIFDERIRRVGLAADNFTQKQLKKSLIPTYNLPKSVGCFETFQDLVLNHIQESKKEPAIKVRESNSFPASAMSTIIKRTGMSGGWIINHNGCDTEHATTIQLINVDSGRHFILDVSKALEVLDPTRK